MILHDIEEHDGGPDEQELEDADLHLREPGHRSRAHPGTHRPPRERPRWERPLSDWEIARQRWRDWEDGFGERA